MAAALAMAPHTDAPVGPPRPLHALVIEDDALIAWAIEAILRDLGYASVETAASEAAAVAAARRCRPDLVTADLRLRPGNGLAAVTAIQVQGPLPVVYVTASRGELTGVDSLAVVDKPFSPADLRRAIAHVQRLLPRPTGAETAG